MILEAFLFLLGVAVGYGCGEKNRRARILAKFDQWTKSKPKEAAK